MILVFLVMASVLFALWAGPEPADREDSGENVARDGALTAVRLLAQDIMEGNRPGEKMEPEKAELEVIPEDGLGTFTVRSPSWAGEGRQKSGPVPGCAPMEDRRRPSPCFEKTEGSGGGATPSSLRQRRCGGRCGICPAEPLEE
ncbi:MAG: hypothetical protein ACLUD2_20870 [Clostridium sp.]